MTIVLVERRKVRSDETLEAIAAAAGLKWRDLAKFNFGTDQVAQVNSHLRTKVGCRRAPEAGKICAFDDRDDPGLLLIPRKWSIDRLATSCHHVIRVRPIVYPRRSYYFSA